jgi:bifunctional DNA-binding transcriptional regulator/antitoxin component of YhaV-PrlF toxin-antitoxin module
MDTVVVSPSYRVRIPRQLCKALAIQPGQHLRIVQYGGRLELVPLRPVFEAPALFGTDAASTIAEDVRAKKGPHQHGAGTKFPGEGRGNR